MAWVKMIEPDEATGELKAEYDEAGRRARTCRPRAYFSRLRTHWKSRSAFLGKLAASSWLKRRS